jgi:hypothetical protein
MFLNAIFFLPNVFVMFLLGLYFGKQGVFGQLAAHRGLMGVLGGVGIPVGVVLNALYAWGLLSALRNENELQSYGWLTLGIVFGPCAGGGLHRRVRVALVGGRGAAACTDAHRRRRSHGAHELPDAVGGLHAAVLRLWTGAARQGRNCAGRIAHAPTVGCAGGVQHALAGAVPVRTDGVALAQSDLRTAYADASRSARVARAKTRKRAGILPVQCGTIPLGRVPQYDTEGG